jgi:hypothetical protein
VADGDLDTWFSGKLKLPGSNPVQSMIFLFLGKHFSQMAFKSPRMLFSLSVSIKHNGYM